MILAALLLQAAEPATAIEAERAFARDAQELGQWTAFAKWAHEDGVLVGRGIIPAKAFASAQDDPPQSLKWWPVRSFQSCDGRVAVNVGGWVDPSTQEAGRFHTVWLHGEDGWRYLADLGASGQASLADTGGVEVIEASCVGLDKSDPVILVQATYGHPQFGRSTDGSLYYHLSLEDDGSRRVTVYLWNGELPEKTYEFEIPAPEPAEPAQ